MKLQSFLRRAPWERTTLALIGTGLAMLMQPWSIDVYSYGFTVLLAGVVGYTIAGKLPAHRHPRGGGDPGLSNGSSNALDSRLRGNDDGQGS